MTVFMTKTKNESASEVVGPERRRRWSLQDKLQMVRESYVAGKLGFHGRPAPCGEPEPAVPVAQAAPGRRPVSRLCR